MFLNENVWIPIKISMKFVPKCPINNIPALVQIMAWRRPGDKPLSEPMMVSLTTHICVIRPQWVNFGKWLVINNSSALLQAVQFMDKCFWKQVKWVQSICHNNTVQVCYVVEAIPDSFQRLAHTVSWLCGFYLVGEKRPLMEYQRADIRLHFVQQVTHWGALTQLCQFTIGLDDSSNQCQQFIQHFHERKHSTICVLIMEVDKVAVLKVMLAIVCVRKQSPVCWGTVLCTIKQPLFLKIMPCEFILHWYIISTYML